MTVNSVLKQSTTTWVRIRCFSKAFNFDTKNTYCMSLNQDKVDNIIGQDGGTVKVWRATSTFVCGSALVRRTLKLGVQEHGDIAH